MKNLTIPIFTLMFALNLFGQSYLDLSKKTLIEGRFVYDVSWTFFHLGTINITIERIIQDPGLKKITVEIKTASGLPFINIDEYNVVVMRISDGMTMYYMGTEELDGEDVEVTCNYYEEEKYALYEVRRLNEGRLIRRDTLSYSKPYLVGSSLIYYTQLIADSGLVINVPTMLGGNIYTTTLDYCGPTEYIEIDKLDEPIRTFRYRGFAGWDGKATAGLSGEFTGWLSNDESSLVIRAEMKIFLGSIDIELEDWYKPGWLPPINKKLLTENK